MRRQSPLPVRQVIRTERPGGSAFVQPFPPPVAAYLQRQLRLASWRLPADHSHNGDMRAIVAALAALGGLVIRDDGCGFDPAGPSEQDYAARHPDDPYIRINDAPKLERLRRSFPKLYRERTAD